MNRRAFVGSAAGGLLALPSSHIFAAASMAKLGTIGLQLYTVRDEMKSNFARTLATVAKAGYKEVEFAGYFGHSASDIRKMLDDNGLVAPSAHIQMSDLGASWEAVLSDASVIGHEYLVCGWIDAEDRTISGFTKIAARFNDAAARASTHGIKFGYHNYSYDLRSVDGQIPYDLLLRECDPQRVVMELDVFWMRMGGGDPIVYIEKYPGRFHMLHLKDMGPPPDNTMLDVGKGVIDWRAILSHGRRAGVKHVFVEHDEPRDAFASIRDSYRYLRRLSFQSYP